MFKKPFKRAGGGDRPFRKPMGDRGGFGGGEKPMFGAVCGTCGAECRVPFRPNGRKPVLCSTCFHAEGGSESRPPRSFDKGPRSFGKPSFARPDRGPSPDLRSIHEKLDRIIEALGIDEE